MVGHDDELHSGARGRADDVLNRAGAVRAIRVDVDDAANARRQAVGGGGQCTSAGRHHHEECYGGDGEEREASNQTKHVGRSSPGMKAVVHGTHSLLQDMCVDLRR